MKYCKKCNRRRKTKKFIISIYSRKIFKIGRFYEKIYINRFFTRKIQEFNLMLDEPKFTSNEELRKIKAELIQRETIELLRLYKSLSSGICKLLEEKIENI